MKPRKPLRSRGPRRRALNGRRGAPPHPPRIAGRSEKGRWFEQLVMRLALQEPEFEIADIDRWPGWPRPGTTHRPRRPRHRHRPRREAPRRRPRRRPVQGLRRQPHRRQAGDRLVPRRVAARQQPRAGVRPPVDRQHVPMGPQRPGGHREPATRASPTSTSAPIWTGRSWRRTPHGQCGRCFPAKPTPSTTSCSASATTTAGASSWPAAPARPSRRYTSPSGSSPKAAGSSSPPPPSP